MSTVNADEEARLAEESIEEGVLPVDAFVVVSMIGFELEAVALVGATGTSRVEASSEMEVSLAFCCCTAFSAEVSLERVGGSTVGAGEQDWLGGES